VALAAEQTGGAQRCLDLAVGHAKERIQFGRPIGSFQAIKHKCADAMVAVETARSAAWAAACTAAEGGDDLESVASLAKAWCSEAYFRCAADALQIHGGVGFTWEYDVHLHLKRARAMESFLGTPAWHRERVARRIGL
jgi:alkylation response protein AidB-like acyl-CoA dehydrogenase